MKNLYQLYQEHDNNVSDKWTHYLHEYDNKFAVYRNMPINLLEIGIQNGGSLEIWAKYFDQGKTFVGCDINVNCNNLVYEDPRISLIIGNANSDEVKNLIITKATKYDLIIDDGSHTSSDIIRSFDKYYDLLEYGGTYVVEDLHCSYWNEFDGGIYNPYSSISFFKKMIDTINHESWFNNTTRESFLRGFKEKYNLNLSEQLLSTISSIEFSNSLCFIKKRKIEFNCIGPRIIAGQINSVVPINRIISTYSFEETFKNFSNLETIESPIEILYSKISNDIVELGKKNEKLRQQNISYENSTSWKLTKPIRILGEQVRRLKKIAKYFGVVINGDIKAVDILKKVHLIYRTEGIVGLKNKILKKDNYAYWLKSYDVFDEAKKRQLLQELQAFSNKPLISVIMPTYNSNLNFLTDAIESVIKQVYPNWELCICDDASTDDEIRKLIIKYSEADRRIKYIFRQTNGHISEASNSALSLASGEWVALLDHDDLLHPESLYWIAKVITRFPNTQLIYSDEDKIDTRANRSAPYFKTDFNRQLFYSHNMITHLGVYRKPIIDKIGGFRKGLEGSQDYDLALRYIENIDVSEIHHIPKVLYHWRMHDQSTAKNADSKPYAMIAGQKALNEHFQRAGLNASSELLGHGYRTHYHLPSILPKVSLIVPTRNGLEFLQKCIESILEKTNYKNYEIIVIDNGSDDLPALDYLKKIALNAKIFVIRDDRPFNYSALNNLGVRNSSGDIVGLINNDIEVISPNWLSEMVSIAIQNDVGAVGAKLLYTDEKIQHAGIVLGIGGWAGHSHKGFPRETLGFAGRVDLMSQFSAVTGACLLIRKELYLFLGGLDEENLKIACNDVDLCLKANAAGYRNIYTPYAELFHHESATRGYEDNPEKQARFKAEVDFMSKKWGTKLSNDPMYSPNLTLHSENFSYAFPTRIKEYEDSLKFNVKRDELL